MKGLKYLWRTLMNSTLMDDGQLQTPRRREISSKSPIYLWTVISPYMITCRQAILNLMLLTFVCLHPSTLIPPETFWFSKSLPFPKYIWPILPQLCQYFGILAFLPVFTLLSQRVLPRSSLGKRKETPIKQFLWDVGSRYQMVTLSIPKNWSCVAAQKWRKG